MVRREVLCRWVGAKLDYDVGHDVKRYSSVYCRCREREGELHFSVPSEALRDALLDCLERINRLPSSREVVRLEFRVDAEYRFAGLVLDTEPAGLGTHGDVATVNRLVLCTFFLGYVRFLRNYCRATSSALVLSPLQLARELHARVFACREQDIAFSYQDCRELIGSLQTVPLGACQGPWFPEERDNELVRECALEIQRTC